eukprot:Seg2440.3 transcript_id=Seg2440.3/GoldUCD/mRNA.D3Y31 product="Protein DD3-3" protein_id=Seg2440.3/GoldUCD/D3Y31
MGALTMLVLMISATALLVRADMYLQNPRGSNNRLDENKRERRNANRMFDSQNNNRGGYNYGSLRYWAGSKMPIQWTNQHSCNDPNNNCEIIIQYMCSDKLRDGTSTRTIPNKLNACKKKDCDSDNRYGMHENFKYYENCQNRERNGGLFTADQKLKGKAAKYTRQNPQGTRRAYECPEERDYYPYWQPSPWRDIVVLTNDASRCNYYKGESQNVRSKFACDVPDDYLYNMRRGRRRKRKSDRFIPITKSACDQISGATWKEYPSHKVAAPDCKQAPWSRDNHNGNGMDGLMNVYNWTVPDIEADSCAMRIRYNISTKDFDTWKTFSNQNGDNGKTTKVPISSIVGLSQDSANERGYVFKNNPEVNPFTGSAKKLELRLAINTAQYGRTFQDRSFSFSVMKRSADLEGKTIYNVNVRGKRGNIVQVYPAVEYDFVPNTLVATSGEYVHFQWTGSNSNPGNNDGQGKRGTDRSNVVLLKAQRYAEGKAKARDVHGHFGRNYPENLSTDTMLDFTREDSKKIAFLQSGSGDELDKAGTNFDWGARKVTSAGTFFYMCTRNNNFSNRSQKGKIVVKSSGRGDPKEAADISKTPVSSEEKEKRSKSKKAAKKDTTGITNWAQELDQATQKDKTASAEAGKASEEKDWVTNMDLQNTAEDPITSMKLDVLSIKKAESMLAVRGGSMKKDHGYASDYLAVYPMKDFANKEEKINVDLKLKKDLDPEYVTVYHSPDLKSWYPVENQDIADNIARIKVNSGGLYVARFAMTEKEKREAQEERDIANALEDEKKEEQALEDAKAVEATHSKGL